MNDFSFLLFAEYSPVHLFLRHHPQLPASEHHCGGWDAGVIQSAGQQIQADTEGLTSIWTSEKICVFIDHVR